MTVNPSARAHVDGYVDADPQASFDLDDLEDALAGEPEEFVERLRGQGDLPDEGGPSQVRAGGSTDGESPRRRGRLFGRR